MSTCQTIIDRAYAKSASSRPETMASSTELIARIGQCLREVFQVIGRENLYLIGTRATVAFDGVGWPRPSDCLRVIKVVADSGTVAAPTLIPGVEINVVSYDDQQFCAGLASLTELGQVFVSTGQTMDPSAGTLGVIYARLPVMPSAVTDSIDTLFPTAFDDLLQFDLAAYLATKDQRAEDEATFLGFKNALVQQLVEWTRGQTYSLVQRFPIVTPPLTNTDGGRQAPEKG